MRAEQNPGQAPGQSAAGGAVARQAKTDDAAARQTADRFSAVIAARNVGAAIAPAVGALRSHPRCARVIVIDDASTDDTAARAAAAGAQVLSHPRRRGVEPALTTGACAVRNREITHVPRGEEPVFTPLLFVRAAGAVPHLDAGLIDQVTQPVLTGQCASAELGGGAGAAANGGATGAGGARGIAGSEPAIVCMTRACHTQAGVQPAKLRGHRHD